MEELLSALRAAGESTRLRILAVLAHGEFTVGELCRVLGQTQPRVSRHLRLLCEAGLLERHAQGTSAFFRIARDGAARRLLDSIMSLLPADDEGLQGDLRRLAAIRAERAAIAAEYFERVAGDWDRVRALHVTDAEVEAAMLAAIGDHTVPVLLDIGTGTGRVLEIFADRIGYGLGLDLSQQMLDLARSRLDQLGLRHCAVRQGNVYDLAVSAGSVDVAVLHHVLHFLDDPAAAIAEAARTLRPGGQILIVDFASHANETMRTEFAHHWLGFADDEVEQWCTAAGLVSIRAQHLAERTRAARQAQAPLTVTVWTATQRADAPALYPLEAAS